MAKDRLELAAVFLEASRLKWEQVSPPLASQISLLQQQFRDRLPLPAQYSDDEIERTCRNWILGKYMDV